MRLKHYRIDLESGLSYILDTNDWKDNDKLPENGGLIFLISEDGLEWKKVEGLVRVVGSIVPGDITSYTCSLNSGKHLVLLSTEGFSIPDSAIKCFLGYGPCYGEDKKFEMFIPF